VPSGIFLPGPGPLEQPSHWAPVGGPTTYLVDLTGVLSFIGAEVALTSRVL